MGRGLVLTRADMKEPFVFADGVGGAGGSAAFQNVISRTPMSSNPVKTAVRMTSVQGPT